MRFFVCIGIMLLGLTGCNGVSGANGDDPFGYGSPGDDSNDKLIVSLLDSQCQSTADLSFQSGEDICVQAKLTRDGNAVSGEIINFTAGIGELEADSKLTDTNGLAQIFLSSNEGEAGTSTLIAQFGELSAQSNYEFISNNSGGISNATIQLSILSSGQLSNRVNAGQSVQVQALLLDQQQLPIADNIVQFSADRGELLSSSALTNSNGIAQVTLDSSASDLGAGTLTTQTTLNNILITDTNNFEIISAGSASDEVVRFGYFNDQGDFVEDQIGSTPQDDVSISAGGTIGLTIALVDENDQPVQNQFQISFTSSCVTQGQANIDSLVTTKNGIARATFEDISCAGSNGITDQVIASVVINNETLTLHKNITIQPESIGSIEFIDASPTSIVLQGTGGQSGSSTAVVTFQVNSALGNPLSQQQVNFSLNTQVGGLHLTSRSGLTNSQGQVSTRVVAGSVPTSVRVTAVVPVADNRSIRTQSDLLSVNTGLPDQNSMSLSASNLNPEANSISGQTVDITARLADSFNNPVPDGTAVSFTTEGGNIEPSCNTSAGACSVVWTSSNPRVDNHRITILATAIGHETLFDSNGNNSYDDNDGVAIIDNTDSGFNTSTYGQTGFVDYLEAWRDDDEDNQHDASEVFLDFDSSGTFTPRDGKFNGPQCLSDSNCGLGSAATMHVRKALVLLMASSEARMDILNSNDVVLFSNYQTSSDPSISINSGQSMIFTLRYSDTASQTMPSNTTVNIDSTEGVKSGVTTDLVPSTNKDGFRYMSFVISHDNSAITGMVIAEVTSPSGVVSRLSFPVTFN